MARSAQAPGGEGPPPRRSRPPKAPTPAAKDAPTPKTSSAEPARRTRPPRSRRPGRSEPAPETDDDTPKYVVSDMPAEGVEPPPKPRRREPSTTNLVRHAVPLDEQSIDPDVARVVRRLMRAGHDAYLVGGCVRDLLLGRTPKDFDVATSARPEDVRALFRNSRIIGRRFRLVHVLFANRKVIEVATFRRNPKPGDDDATDEELLIRSDNAFGTIEEDAIRRDFTINALFYDVEGREILDFTDGMPDIRRRAVRTIGDPATRFKEDPVRILRAVKFAGKLDLGIDPDVVDAMVATREQLRLAAKPRLFEEILRLMRGGASRRSIFLAWDTGMLHVLLPELASMMDDVGEGDAPASRVFRLLAELDHRTEQKGEPFDDVVLWTLLLLEPLLEACEGERDRIGAAIAFCDPILERLSVPRRIADSMRRIVAVLPRLHAGKLGRFARNDLFDQAVAVAEMRLAAIGDREAVARLRKALGES
jgi:poly(A) polymerase